MDETGNFQDWEVLQNSGMGPVHPSDPSRDFGGIEGDTEGSIRSDYFSLSSDNRYARTAVESDDPSAGEGSDVSDNPSWVDPSSEPRFGDSASAFQRKNLGDPWSDSGSDLSGSQKSLNFDGRSEVGCGGDSNRELVSGRLGEMEEFKVKNTAFSEFCSDSGSVPSFWMKSGAAQGEYHSGFGVSGQIEDGRELSPEGDPLKESELGDAVDVGGGSEFVEGQGSEIPREMENHSGKALKSGEGVVGLVTLGRRLHKLRRKSQSIPLKFTVDDKKVSQFKIRAARLNEAFSIVKRVPMIRPSLPATGITPWPVMSLR